MPSASEVPPDLGDAPEVARILFGERLPSAMDYAQLLVAHAIPRGLLGPREAARIWERHLLNCAVVTDLCREQAVVYDVGSGAGLPGIVWAIRRPDLVVTLLEPLLRRVTFLMECVEKLGLPNVTVLRCRVEDVDPTTRADIVTARAVAPLDRLAPVSWRLLRPGGELLAIKGSSAVLEARRAQPTVSGLGGSEVDVVSCGIGLVEPPTVVLRVRKAQQVATSGAGTRSDSRPRRARRSR